MVIITNYGLSYTPIKKVASSSITDVFTRGIHMTSTHPMHGLPSLIVIRDPVDRFLASWWHLRGRDEFISKDFWMSLDDFISLVESGDGEELNLDNPHLIDQQKIVDRHPPDITLAFEHLDLQWKLLQADFPDLPNLPHHNNLKEHGHQHTCRPDQFRRIEKLYA
jgi:hypothetical protein